MNRRSIAYRLQRFARRMPVYAMAILCAAASMVCDAAGDSVKDGALRVGVSVAPQKYLVDRIGGEDVQVRVLIPVGVDPHSYEPGPEQLRILSDLVVYFRQGLEFEKSCLRRLRGINAGLRVVDLGPQSIQPFASTRDDFGPGDSSNDSSNDSGHEHAHGKGHLNPHTWLSPRIVREQSDAILGTLVELRPESRARFTRGHRELRAELDQVDAYIRRRLAPFKNQLLVVYHPSWEYFARDYGLRMIAVQADGHEPSARDLMRLVRLSRAAGVKAIFAEPGFNPRSVEVVARDLDARVETIDPLAPDWAQNLCDTADQIAEALAP
ncbi:MAG: zinc ABC transporter substrate-binding protein [bacterium]|nr:zinc ABC transporter substrate-binding protein [bacterium]